MSSEISTLDALRNAYRPRVPRSLGEDVAHLTLVEADPPRAAGTADAIREHFPHTHGRPLVRFETGGATPVRGPLTVGVVLSGGQAPGGHNVIAGLHDALQALHPRSRLIGFRRGPRGILAGDHEPLDAAHLAPFRNTGGFDLLGSGRDKIETDEHVAAAARTCRELALDGLVIVGGDDSNTNAAVLAERFSAQELRTSVIGVPKTIDGDLRGEHIEIPFGFDTATRVYAELVGNVCRDARSSRKYWHFIRLMGRSASHVTLEVALHTRPNVVLVGEEVRARGLELGRVVDELAEVVRRRAEAGRRYGVCLVPEGLLEFVPGMAELIAELNRELAGGKSPSLAQVREALSPAARESFERLPERIAEQLLLDRDAHGNVKVSQIETEDLLVQGVQRRLGRSFDAQRHFFGYEGRAAQPTNFDADYTDALGRLAAVLVAFELTGYVCGLEGLVGPAESWRPVGIPLVSMLHLEMRHGRRTPVIAKALVDLHGPAFGALAAARERWAEGDHYLHPGPIQYFGPDEISRDAPASLRLAATGTSSR